MKINRIKEWLIGNKAEFQKLKAKKFPPIDNSFYDTYNCLDDCIQYYKYEKCCDIALTKLQIDNVRMLSNWTKEYEIMGSQNLLMFEVNYIKWDENVSIDKLKIHKELYTEIKPFANILCFCKVFQHLYWDNELHDKELAESEKVAVVNKLKNILKAYYYNTKHD